MTELHIGRGLDLPISTATSTIAVLGGKGMGKTNLDAVIAEECVACRIRFSWMDPIGVAWSLQHGADDSTQGLEVLVLGGVHGDIPIEPTAGAIVADLVVDHDVSVVIDISRHPTGKMWSHGEQIRFVTDYMVRLYERQGEDRRPLLQIFDEIGRFAPQNIPHGAIDISKCVGALEQAMELGRNVGIGMVISTQRSARVSKSLLELADALFAFRTVGPLSVKAVVDWLGEHVARERIREIVEQVRSLPVGNALLISPGWLQIERVVTVRMRTTFDASATPTGESIRAPGAARKPDLEKYRELMKATIEKVKAEDPKALQRRIRELEAELRARPANVETVEKIVEVPILGDGRLDEIRAIAVDLLAVSTKLHDGGRLLMDAVHPVVTEMQRIQPSALSEESSRAGRSVHPADRALDDSPVRAAAPRPVSPGTDRQPKSATVRSGEPRATEGVTPTQQRILDSVALLEHRGAEISIVAIAAVAGVHPNGGRFRGDVKALQSAELLDSTYRLTHRGAAGAAVEDKVAPNQQKILELLGMLEANGLDANPKTIAAWLDLSPNGGRFRGDLKHLQTTGLLDGYRLTRAAKRHVNELTIDALAAALARLDPSTARLLQLVRNAGGKGLSVSEAAAKLNLHPNGGRFRSSIGRLFEMGVIRSKSELALSDAVRQVVAA